MIQSSVEDKLSDAVLAGEFGTGDIILVDAEDDEIVLSEREPGTDDEGEVEEEEALPAP